MRYCFVFVCQQGELELKALLLAASLRRFLRVEYELVAALPQPESTWGRPSAKTLELLAGWGVRTVPISNPVGTDYPIGNKLACLQIETSADKMVFLDSDLLCMREFGHQACFKLPFNAKPADLATFSLDAEQWRRAYAALDLPPPREAVAATVSGQLMPPYFNAGFIAVHRHAGFGDAWIAAALAIDRDIGIENKRPWLDQIALPVALAKLGIGYACLDERYNYPVHLKPLALDPADLPWFCHYHSPEVLRREPQANALLVSLAQEHPDMMALIAADPAWRGLLQPYQLNRPSSSRWFDRLLHRSAGPSAVAMRSAPELIFTGIPRSGTSYLCKLAHAVENCVVINEPAEIFAPLAQQTIPWGVATYYRELRRDILDGKPIPNKLQHGEFIEDTAQADMLESYFPQVSRPDFLLATKNTLAYLARLPQLRRIMPEAVIAACVRHPLDTIASWKTTFPHLANADMESQLLGSSRDPNLSGLQRERLKEIAAVSSAALKRALLWRYLAEILLDHRQSIVLIHYETMVTNPGATLQRIFAALPLRHPQQQAFPLRFTREIAASSPRHKRAALDAEDMDAIGGICAQTAAELGYEIF